MTIFHPIVQPSPHFATIKVAQLAHRRGVGTQPVRDDSFSLAVTLQRLLHERQSRSFVPFLRHVTLQDLALVVDRTPQVMRLAIDIHIHLIEMPLPLAEAAHSGDTLPANIRGKERTEAVPPQSYRLMAKIDATLKQMGWLPPSPDGIAMCQERGVYSH